jgi:hypothetical protein
VALVNTAFNLDEAQQSALEQRAPHEAPAGY